jgi:hypothetical protein
LRFDRAETGTDSDKDIGESQDKSSRWDIIVLSRGGYDWTHGIDKKKRDYVSLPADQVQDLTRIPRIHLLHNIGLRMIHGTRPSITFADMVRNNCFVISAS